jgi:hypothetical protein
MCSISSLANIILVIYVGVIDFNISILPHHKWTLFISFLGHISDVQKIVVEM